jgi:hypothetical protein
MGNQSVANTRRIACCRGRRSSCSQNFVEYFKSDSTFEEELLTMNREFTGVLPTWKHGVIPEINKYSKQWIELQDF